MKQILRLTTTGQKFLILPIYHLLLEDRVEEYVHHLQKIALHPHGNSVTTNLYVLILLPFSCSPPKLTPLWQPSVF